MNPADKRDRQESTRHRILSAARTLAGQYGYKGTTLAMIQREAGVHPGSLYWHFADKDALFAALVESAYSASRSVSVQGSANPVLAVLQSIVDNPERYGLWRFNVQTMLDEGMADSKTAEVIRGLRIDSQKAVTSAWMDDLPPVVSEADPGLQSRLAQVAQVTVEGCILARVAGRPVDEDAVTRDATARLDQMVDAACKAAGVATPAFVRDRMHGH